MGRFSGFQEIMHHEVAGFFQRTPIGTQQYIGLFVNGGALLQECIDGLEGIGSLQQGAVGLGADPIPYRLCRGPEANHECMAFEAFQVLRIGSDAAARADDESCLTFQLIHNDFFIFTEPCFSFLFKDLGDSPACMVFDEVVCVDELHVQLSGRKTSHR